MTFEQIIDDKNMLANLSQLGYKNPTLIQEKTIPPLLEKRDILARAKTGSGKTAAFGIPLILNLHVEKKDEISALVLTPTRELATQVAAELRKLARCKENAKIITLTGGTPLRAEANSLKHGAHIVVGTPGRILDHLEKETLSVKTIKTLILDEADKMLDMGFYPDIEKIISHTNEQRQTLLFSATFSEDIKALSSKIQKQRVAIEIESKICVDEFFLDTKHFSKEELLENTLLHFMPKSCIIFANTKVKSFEIEDFLTQKGYDALCINSDLEQIDRDENLIRFSNASATFLIATDVASRGIDIKNVDLVINFDEPQDPQTYTHRIGRTGRNDTHGIAVTFSKKIPQESQKLSLHVEGKKAYKASMQTLCIHGGKKQKLRAGDIVGTLIQSLNIEKEHIGVINVGDNYSYVALEKKSAQKLQKKLHECIIKKKRFKVWFL